MKTSVPIIVFDLEIYCNFFSGVFYNRTTKEISKFIIFFDPETGEIINDYDKFYKFITQNAYFVGYNSTFYDMQIMEFLFQYNHKLKDKTSKSICESLYKLSKSIINDNFKGYVYTNNIKHFDLMKLGGNNGLMKGLKSIACNLKQPLIQDLPIHHTATIKATEVGKIIRYNIKDVVDTEALFCNLIDKIANRIDTYNKFKVYCMNDTDSGVANRLLEHFYTEKTKESIMDVKKMRVFPNKISLSDCIPSGLLFYSAEMKAFVNDLRKIEIDTNSKKITIPNSPILEFDGVRYQIGAGGLHSIDKGAIFTSNDNFILRDADVRSYYPMNMITNKLKPRHLDDSILDILEYLIDHRVEAKVNGDTSTANIFKIVINSIFGKTGSKYSWLYDPLTMLQVTISGQLYLLQLIDWLWFAEISVISANTDGIIAKIHKDKLSQYNTVCEAWCKQTNFQLEYIDYTKYVRRDVNNYLAVTKDGKVKCKGVFNPDMYKNVEKAFNYPIISKALYEYFVNNIDYTHTIKNHKDILDFCTAPKADKKFTIEFITFDDKGTHKVDTLQKTNRYYVSRGGGKLIKREPSKKNYTEFESGETIIILNDLEDGKDINDYNIKHMYYINKVRGIISICKNRISQVQIAF